MVHMKQFPHLSGHIIPTLLDFNTVIKKGEKGTFHFLCYHDPNVRLAQDRILRGFGYALTV